MKYKNNSFIQYFNKLHEKIRRKKSENCITIIDLLFLPLKLVGI